MRPLVVTNLKSYAAKLTAPTRRVNDSAVGKTSAYTGYGVVSIWEWLRQGCRSSCFLRTLHCLIIRPDRPNFPHPNHQPPGSKSYGDDQNRN